MAWHVRGVVLPDDEVRDLWFVGDRVTLEPVPDAVTLSDRGFVLPGLVDAHCHLGIRAGGEPVQSLDEARELGVRPRRWACSRSRRVAVPVPEPDDDPEVPLLGPAGHRPAPPKRYPRDVGIEVPAHEVVATVAARRRRQRLGRAGRDWIDREVGTWPRPPPGRVRPGDRGRPRRGGQGGRAHVRRGVGGGAGGPVDSVEHGTGPSEEDIAEMARREPSHRR
jgi:hypothetical protein